jgi:hypothetical protein
MKMCPKIIAGDNGTLQEWLNHPLYSWTALGLMKKTSPIDRAIAPQNGNKILANLRAENSKYPHSPFFTASVRTNPLNTKNRMTGGLPPTRIFAGV